MASSVMPILPELRRSLLTQQSQTQQQRKRAAAATKAAAARWAAEMEADEDNAAGDSFGSPLAGAPNADQDSGKSWWSASVSEVQALERLIDRKLSKASQLTDLAFASPGASGGGLDASLEGSPDATASSTMPLHTSVPLVAPASVAAVDALRQDFARLAAQVQIQEGRLGPRADSLEGDVAELRRSFGAFREQMQKLMREQQLDMLREQRKDQVQDHMRKSVSDDILTAFRSELEDLRARWFALTREVEEQGQNVLVCAGAETRRMEQLDVLSARVEQLAGRFDQPNGGDVGGLDEVRKALEGIRSQHSIFARQVDEHSQRHASHAERVEGLRNEHQATLASVVAELRREIAAASAASGPDTAGGGFDKDFSALRRELMAEVAAQVTESKREILADVRRVSREVSLEVLQEVRGSATTSPTSGALVSSSQLQDLVSVTSEAQSQLVTVARELDQVVLSQKQVWQEMDAMKTDQKQPPQDLVATLRSEMQQKHSQLTSATRAELSEAVASISKDVQSRHAEMTSMLESLSDLKSASQDLIEIANSVEERDIATTTPPVSARSALALVQLPGELVALRSDLDRVVRELRDEKNNVQQMFESPRFTTDLKFVKEECRKAVASLNEGLPSAASLSSEFAQLQASQKEMRAQLAVLSVPRLAMESSDAGAVEAVEMEQRLQAVEGRSPAIENIASALESRVDELEKMIITPRADMIEASGEEADRQQARKLAGIAAQLGNDFEAKYNERSMSSAGASGDVRANIDGLCSLVEELMQRQLRGLERIDESLEKFSNNNELTPQGVALDIQSGNVQLRSEIESLCQGVRQEFETRICAMRGELSPDDAGDVLADRVESLYGSLERTMTDWNERFGKLTQMIDSQEASLLDLRNGHNELSQTVQETLTNERAQQLSLLEKSHAALSQMVDLINESGGARSFSSGISPLPANLGDDTASALQMSPQTPSVVPALALGTPSQIASDAASTQELWVSLGGKALALEVQDVRQEIVEMQAEVLPGRWVELRERHAELARMVAVLQDTHCHHIRLLWEDLRAVCRELGAVGAAAGAQAITDQAAGVGVAASRAVAFFEELGTPRRAELVGLIGEVRNLRQEVAVMRSARGSAPVLERPRSDIFVVEQGLVSDAVGSAKMSSEAFVVETVEEGDAWRQAEARRASATYLSSLMTSSVIAASIATADAQATPRAEFDVGDRVAELRQSKDDEIDDETICSSEARDPMSPSLETRETVVEEKIRKSHGAQMAGNFLVESFSANLASLASLAQSDLSEVPAEVKDDPISGREGLGSPVSSARSGGSGRRSFGGWRTSGAAAKASTSASSAAAARVSAEEEGAPSPSSGSLSLRSGWRSQLLQGARAEADPGSATVSTPDSGRRTSFRNWRSSRPTRDDASADE